MKEVKLIFSKRIELEKEYLSWIKDTGAKDSFFNFLVFLQTNTKYKIVESTELKKETVECQWCGENTREVVKKMYLHQSCYHNIQEGEGLL